LRKARHAAGMTLQDLAVAAGVGSWPHLSRIERGDANVTIDTMHALAKALAFDLHVTMRRVASSDRKEKGRRSVKTHKKAKT